MPRRPPINPVGWYHIGSRGCYGRTLYETPDQHEVFLRMYARAARKYGWETPSWALMKNHHHFVVRLTEGGLSEGMRLLHCGYSRWIHELYGQTRQGHLFRHAFFARELLTEGDVLVACSYVDLNAAVAQPGLDPEHVEWCGYRATIGLEHPRPFHTPSTLLQLLGKRPAAARAAYRELIQERLALRRHDPSPNAVL
jgi:REP element-mobilizing transposase RayT